MRLSRTTAAILTFSLTSLCASLSPAQEFPTKPVRMVVPFPPGGPLDLSGRLIGQQLSEMWKQPVIVENRPGGTLGADTVSRAAPDGYTLLIISSSPLITLPHLQKVQYDPLKDLVGVTQTVHLTYALVTQPDSTFNSMQDIVDQAKKSPGKINFASAGNGSGQHLIMELFKGVAGIDLTHVPFKGAGPALQAFLGAQVPLMLDVTTATVPLVRSGKAKVLMVTGGKSIEQHPGAPPFDSLYPGVGIPTWHGIFTTGGTPAPIVAKLAADVQAVLKLPAVNDRFRQLGVEPSGVSGEAFATIGKNNLRSD
jgi:tripartite-type tricarboxylate transporter receptor subunit TctC